METWVPILIQLVSGAVGGNIAGAAMKDKSLGTIGNSIVGILGGGVGGQILGLLGIGVSSGTDLSGIAGDVGSGGVGGAVLLLIVAIIRKMLNK